ELRRNLTERGGRPRTPPDDGLQPAQRFENWGRLRAFLSPAFRRSLTLASRVKNPRRLSSLRSSGSISVSARAIPCRNAPAWPPIPPPCTLTRTSTVPS